MAWDPGPVDQGELIAAVGKRLNEQMRWLRAEMHRRYWQEETEMSEPEENLELLPKDRLAEILKAVGMAVPNLRKQGKTVYVSFGDFYGTVNFTLFKALADVFKTDRIDVETQKVERRWSSWTADSWTEVEFTIEGVPDEILAQID